VSGRIWHRAEEGEAWEPRGRQIEFELTEILHSGLQYHESGVRAAAERFVCVLSAVTTARARFTAQHLQEPAIPDASLHCTQGDGELIICVAAILQPTQGAAQQGRPKVKATTPASARRQPTAGRDLDTAHDTLVTPDIASGAPVASRAAVAFVKDLVYQHYPRVVGAALRAPRVPALPRLSSSAALICARAPGWVARLAADPCPHPARVHAASHPARQKRWGCALRLLQCRT